jgi:hypothetical protein
LICFPLAPFTKIRILASYEIIIFIALAFVLAVAGTAVSVLANLNAIVKAAIEKYGSEAAKTKVRVSSVKIKAQERRVCFPWIESGQSFRFLLSLHHYAR